MTDDSRDIARFGETESHHDQVVCHIDMDCFYAACERLREPALRGEPLVVGMGYESGENHGAVATASYEAREYGVESAMGIGEALDRLPRKVEAARDPDLDVSEAGFYRTVDIEYYESVGAEVKEILHDHADVVREVSIDEAYLDVTERVRWDSQDTADEDGVRETSGGKPTASEFARELKETVREEVGVVASVGVAPTMSAAKIASDYDKPDGLVVVEPGEVREFLAPLSIEEIHNVGPVTARELRDIDIETAADLAAADPDRLRDRFGERGLEVRRFARGDDPREVQPVGDPKSLSRESAFTEVTADSEAKRDRVRDLAADVAERAEREGALYQTIGIKAVQPPYDVNTRAESLPGPVQNAELVEERALDLLDEFDGEKVRKLGVRVSNLSFSAGDQSSLSGFGSDQSGDESGAVASGNSGETTPITESTAEKSEPTAETTEPAAEKTEPTLGDYATAVSGDGDGDERTADDGQQFEPTPDWQTTLSEFE